MPKTGPVPKAVSFCSPYSHLCRLVSVESGNQDGCPRCSGKVLPGRLDTSPLAGKVPGWLELKMRSVSEALWLLPFPEAVSFCCPHSHLHRLVSEGSRNHDGFPRCSGKALSSRSDISPLAGDVPRCLEPETGSASEAVL